MDFWIQENEKQQDFTGEEIASFKRYIEENDVYNDNTFEFTERNLDYFSARYTRDDFTCYAELFHVNSDFWNSDEMDENIELYEKSVQWRNKTVHPEDSEYVIKEEKYLYLESFSEKFRNIVSSLNKQQAELFSCIDLLFFVEGSFYQYLPQKNFVFMWGKNGKKIVDRISEWLSVDFEDKIVVIPIFVPIRKMLFFGEYGYREAMIDYGRVLSEITHSVSDAKIIRRFETRAMNEKFRLDSVEKSILSIISC